MNRSRRPLVVTLCVALFALWAVPGVSAAQCVGFLGLECHQTYSGDNDGIHDALIAAAAAADPAEKTVLIGAGTYSALQSAGEANPAFPLLNPATYAANGPIHVRGAGVGKTILTGSADTLGLVRVWFPTPTSTLSGVTVWPTATGAADERALNLVNGQVSDFEIVEQPSASQGMRGVVLHSGNSLKDGRIATVGSSAWGIDMTSPPGQSVAEIDAVEIEAATPSAQYGIRTIDSQQTGREVTAKLSRVSISGFKNGIYSGARTTRLSDVLIDLKSWSGGTGVFVVSYYSGDETIDFEARRSTFVGDDPSQVGINAQRNPSDNDLLNVQLADTVIDVGGSPLRCTIGDVNKVRVASVAVGGAQDGCETAADNNVGDLITLAASPFVDAGAGDYRPLKSSVLVDGGSSTAEVPLGAVDLGGSPRVSGSKVDIGAFEYQHAAPQVTLAAAKMKLAGGESTTFTATATDADDDAASLARSWSVDGVAQPGSDLTLRWSSTTPGAHTVSFTATDPAGLAATASVVVSVAKPASAKLTVKPKKNFKRGKKSFSVMKAAKTKKAKQKAKKTPSFSVRFAESARAKLVLQVKKGKKFKAVKGTQTLKVKNGTVKLTFGGGWAKKKLKAGTYRLRLTPLNAVGTAGKMISLTLRVR